MATELTICYIARAHTHARTHICMYIHIVRRIKHSVCERGMMGACFIRTVRIQCISITRSAPLAEIPTNYAHCKFLKA